MGLRDGHESISNTTSRADDDGAETLNMAHDSMVTVRLSEPPALTVNTNVGPKNHDSRPNLIGGELIPMDQPKIGGELIPYNPTPAAVIQEGPATSRQESPEPTVEDNTNDDSDEEVEEQEAEKKKDITGKHTTTEILPGETARSLQDELGEMDEVEDVPEEQSINTDDSHDSDEEEEVNWEELQKSEDSEMKEQEPDADVGSPSSEAGENLAE